MSEILDGNAVVYCEGSYDTTDGKTAHGLVRFTNRYRVIAVIDSHCAGKDAGEILDGKYKGISVYDVIIDGASGLVETLKRYMKGYSLFCGPGNSAAIRNPR